MSYFRDNLTRYFVLNGWHDMLNIILFMILVKDAKRLWKSLRDTYVRKGEDGDKEWSGRETEEEVEIHAVSSYQEVAMVLLWSTIKGKEEHFSD